MELLSDIYDDLRDSKFVSQTKGKGIFLLSTHAKARREYKKRRIHEISKEPGQFYADSQVTKRRHLNEELQSRK